MIEQLKTIREFVESVHEGEWLPYVSREATLSTLTQLEAMVEEPYGTVTVVRNPGCAEQHWFYRWPDPPYLDNAAECHTVYAAPIAQQPQTEAVPWAQDNLDSMVEALRRVIEVHYNTKQPFHNPVYADAHMAHRLLVGYLPYMKNAAIAVQREQQ